MSTCNPLLCDSRGSSGSEGMDSKGHLGRTSGSKGDGMSTGSAAGPSTTDLSCQAELPKGIAVTCPWLPEVSRNSSQGTSTKGLAASRARQQQQSGAELHPEHSTEEQLPELSTLSDSKHQHRRD